MDNEKQIDKNSLKSHENKISDMNYYMDLLPYPSDAKYPDYDDKSTEEPIFDPKIHLCITYPENVTLLDFSTEKLAPESSKSKLAFTNTFRILSDEGVKVIREIILRNEKHTRTCERTPDYYAGLAYTSKFLRDFNESPDILNFLSILSGIKLLPHYLVSNYSQINIGKIGSGKPVDQWHTDSVHFVMVVILSDIEGMEGGELECIRRDGKQQGFDLIKQHKNSIPENELLRVKYQAAGYAVFMQGNNIVHHVTPVKKGKESRITCINSYMPANCFAYDATIYDTFKEYLTTDIEYSRAKAWRAMTQLKYFCEVNPYTNMQDKSYISNFLKNTIKELQHTVDVIEGKEKEELGFFDEINGTVKKNYDV